MIKVYTENLRDQYAGQAMAALIQKDYSFNAWEIARKAYDIADAMIEIKLNHETTNHSLS